MLSMKVLALLITILHINFLIFFLKKIKKTLIFKKNKKLEVVWFRI